MLKINWSKWQYCEMNVLIAISDHDHCLPCWIWDILSYWMACHFTFTQTGMHRTFSSGFESFSKIAKMNVWLMPRYFLFIFFKVDFCQVSLIRRGIRQFQPGADCPLMHKANKWALKILFFGKLSWPKYFLWLALKPFMFDLVHCLLIASCVTQLFRCISILPVK